EVINARETVPKSSTLDLTQFDSDLTEVGAQWIGVPGELRGYEVAHQRHGRLPWKSLFQPTIKLVTEGFLIGVIHIRGLNNSMHKIDINSILIKLLCKGQDLVTEGQSLNFTQLAHTLRVVSEKGADAFYQGPIAEQMLEDLKSQGSNLTQDDLTNYKVLIGRALNVSLANHTLYSAQPPAGGALLSFILKVLEGYNFSESSIQNKRAQIETYHRIAEAMKFANGQKIKMADFGMKRMEELKETVLSETFAQQIRERINDYGNHSLSYYSLNGPHSESFGTSHISVISQDGSAVSATSSINQIFGSMVYSPQTGIVFNNQLADFCSDAIDSHYLLAIAMMIFLYLGERPPSSMAPSILLSDDKKSQLVIGASGGSYIISSTALAIVNTLWFGVDLKKAISDPILHNKIFPGNWHIEKNKNRTAIEELLKRNHNL
uniref:Gamma-glutamyltransferase 5 n=1 Tax=Xenopus tropicalis TaxID=8364 RepID=A0A803JCP7_XENTR